jgi:DNA ligase-associated metallophosphoesterase
MILGSQEITIKKQTLSLLPQKALYWKEQNILVVSDIHFGKSGHFRKHGIAVPDTVNTTNIQKLEELVQHISPKKILFLGDLFHSEINAEVEQFKEWRMAHADIEMILTIGNHDILTRFEFEKMKLVCVNQYELEPFVFMHDESESKNSSRYPITGHIHPAVKLTVGGRQRIYVPCFYFGKSHGMLPAFGVFTGSYLINPAQNDLVYAVVEEKITNVSTLI